MSTFLTNEDRLLIEENTLNAIMNECTIEEVDLLSMMEESGGFSFGEDYSLVPMDALDEANKIIERVFYLYTTAKTYEVGGAVRDNLMGLTPKDVDYVVVGATPQDMLDHGFQQVGAAFPVFLHPLTGDEYALARREKKVGAGYHGFDVEFGVDVTLEEDLQRRDFTVNAIAYDPIEAELIDPYGGREDIKACKLVMVNPDAFKDDPLRVIRGIRLAARWPDFTFDDATAKAIRELLQTGALDEIAEERQFAELKKVYTDANFNADKIIKFWDFIDRFGVPMNSAFYNSLIPECAGKLHQHQIISRFAVESANERVRSEFPDITTDEQLMMTLVLAVSYYRPEEFKFGRNLLNRHMAEASDLVRHFTDATQEYKDVSEFYKNIGGSLLGIRAHQSGRERMVELLDYSNYALGGVFPRVLGTIAGRMKEVKAEQFPDLEGRDLGDAIRKVRIELVEPTVNELYDLHVE